MFGHQSESDHASPPCNVWLVGQESPAVQRGSRYSPESVKGHPGKMLPALAGRLIETYTRPGERILDPLSGIGTTGVEAIHKGRHYVGLELEEKYIVWQMENLNRARAHGAEGEFALWRTDSRFLDPSISHSAPLKGLGPYDAVLTSPPYGGRLEKPRTKPLKSFDALVRQGKLGATAVPASFGLSAENLGNLKEDTQYFSGVGHVYAGCYELLKPGGWLILTVRPARNRQHLRPLHLETVRICTTLGFHLIDEIIAVLARIEVSPDRPPRVITHSSFGRRRSVAHMREKGWPITLHQVEYALVFQKPLLPRSKTKEAAITPPLSSDQVPFGVPYCTGGTPPTVP